MFIFCRGFSLELFFVLYFWLFNKPLRSGVSMKIDKQGKKSIVLNVHKTFFRNNVSLIQLLSYCCYHNTITKRLRQFMKPSDSKILYPALLLNSCFCPGRTVLHTLGSWALYVSGYQHFLQVSASSRLTSGLCLEQQDVRHLLHRPREPPSTASRMCSV